MPDQPPAAAASSSSSSLAQALLKTIESSIIPLTREGVSSGSKVFGAAILDRSTLQPLTVATNDERASPLFHGEIACIQKFFTADFPDPGARADPRTGCVFLATHEPCSLCLSGITWSGFAEVYYLFTYEDSRDLFAIPYDIEILEEVFRVRAPGETEEQLRERPLYNRQNKFFRARSVQDLVASIEDEDERARLAGEASRIKKLYGSLSETYQQGKQAGVESASVWK